MAAIGDMMDVSGCTICYETLGEKNCCTTECGHKFCFKCIATAMQYNNSCPYCRTALIDEPAEDNNESDNEVGSIAEDETDDEESDAEAEVEDVAKQLQEKGVTMVDVLSLLIGRYSKNRNNNNLNNDEQFESLHHRIWDIIVQIDDECIEQHQMMKEDINSLAISLALPKPT